MEKLVKTIEEQLRKNAPDERLSGRDKLLGKPFRSLGIPLKQVRKTISEIYRENPRISSEAYTSVAEKLLAKDFYEEKMSAIFLLGESIKDGQALDFPILERLINSYVDEWSLCDTFATEIVAPSLLTDWDIGQEVLIEWSGSQNEWVRRSALVGLVKCKDRVSNWREFSQSFLNKFERENEKIVKKAAAWLKRELSA
jgi:3-methyladenine DNA glycosylase AlkD